MEISIIGIVCLLQFYFFFKTLSLIIGLKNFFPPEKNLSITSKETVLGWGAAVTTELIDLKGKSSEGFKESLESTNSYLINNKGSAADFNIIKDIIERHLETRINGINTSVSTPLFLGLAGTFFGIIYGLSFLEFTQANGISTISTEGITSLIDGVKVAMIASAIGLLLTLINSSWIYKEALHQSEKAKNKYYDFIQSNLLPKLSKDVSDSLGSLKSNLDHFNNKFGENLINYKDSFKLLNENLTKEKDFLEAIQEVGLKKLSSQIVKTFEQVNEASNEFHDFQQYQVSLNKNVSASIAILEEYNSITSSFKNFNSNLDSVSQHIIESSDFYHEFKRFLENHFSEVEHRKNIFTASIEKIDDVLTSKLKELSQKSLEQKDFYNEQWRSTADILNKDITGLFSTMAEYVQEEAESLKKYIATEEHGLQQIFAENKSFFKDFKYVEQLFTKFSTFTEVSQIHSENVENGLKVISNLLSDEASLINVNKNLVEIRIAIEELTQVLAAQNKELA